MPLQYTVISIGALSRNPFWNEAQAKRVSHATTTLIRDGKSTILVDPSLPAEVLAQRLEERSGLMPDQITTVFLTTFRPVHRRALNLFPAAKWLMHEAEIEAVGEHLSEMAERMEGDTLELVKDEQALLRKIRPAGDKIAPQVDLFPAPGASAGSSALLLGLASRTVLVAGDAVLTRDHYEAGRVFEQSVDVERARQSFLEIAEIADEIVPGHDNAFTVVGH